MLGVYTWSAEAGRAARVAEDGESTAMQKADFEMVRSGDEENNGESPLSASVMNPMNAPPPGEDEDDGGSPFAGGAAFDDEEGNGTETIWCGGIKLDLSVLLMLSVFLNVLLTLGFAITRSTVESMSSEECGDGTLKARVKSGSFGCSGHGIYDFLSEDCRCHECWTGSACDVQEGPESCSITVEGGDPLIFEEYWMWDGGSGSGSGAGLSSPDRALRAAVLTPADFRIGYHSDGAENWYATAALEDAIHAMHAMVGNVDVEGTHSLVLGTGSTQLINAVFYGLTKVHGPRAVTQEGPYYQAHKSSAAYFNSSLFAWSADSLTAASAGGPSAAECGRSIEVVTSPNNPDGSLRDALCAGAVLCSAGGAKDYKDGSCLRVHDLAYYWPHFTPITEPKSEDVMLFTLSKLTGHAGTRVGWAFVRDERVAEEMRAFVGTTSLGVPHDAQLRASSILQVVEEDGGALLTAAHGLMAGRWAKIAAALTAAGTTAGTASAAAAAAAARYSHQALAAPAVDAWMGGDARDPSPAYLWVECLWASEAGDCYQAFKDNGIEGRPGLQYGAGPEFVRFSLLMREVDFETFIARLSSLASEEESS